MNNKRHPARLILEDGIIFNGYTTAENRNVFGEVVFNTSMVGYQEMATDPSYREQILVLSYPMIGNYGCSEDAKESERMQVKGLIVRDVCEHPSHIDSKSSVSEYFKSEGKPLMHGVDTRMLIKVLRDKGALCGCITTEQDDKKIIKEIREYKENTFRKHLFEIDKDISRFAELGNKYKDNVVILDYGVRRNVIRILHGLKINAKVCPYTSTVEDVLVHKPIGIILSPGPGDPSVTPKELMEVVEDLAQREIPMLGICIGHQLIATTFGAKTFKLKFGHRGANHTIENSTNRSSVYITAQNHGYAVDEDSVLENKEIEVTHRELHDKTIEGISHKSLPIYSIQWHPESSPGPKDTEYILKEFIELCRKK